LVFLETMREGWWEWNGSDASVSRADLMCAYQKRVALLRDHVRMIGDPLVPPFLHCMLVLRRVTRNGIPIHNNLLLLKDL
jgi:hypothetical protein